MNRHFKTVIEQGVLLTGFAGFSRRRNRQRALVLLYHNVIPEGTKPAGELSLHLPLEDFRRHLDHLDRSCDVVPLEALVDEVAPSKGRVRVAITFDDAYVGALTVGVPELVRRGMPATIFVPPGLFGRRTWWDVVASQTMGEMPEARRTDLLTRLGGNWEAILGSGDGMPGHLPEIAEESQVLHAAALPGITIGSHTWMHPNLSVISPDNLHTELARSMDWLRTRFPGRMPLVSYPYGLSSPSVEAAASAVGYRAGFLAGGGWLPPAVADGLFRLPRYNVPAGLSLNGFRIRLSGLGLE
jgi:peptidoglycan/xylan/chitin deacetylase (PgdA/CDA1 family)